MKLPFQRPKPLTGVIVDPRHGPRSGPAVSGVHRDPDAWKPSPPRVVDLTVPEAVIINPKPYRGAVAKSVQGKMIRENIDNFLELTKMGAREQAWTQLWSNFTKICYAVGVPVDTNADLRVH